MIADRLRVVAVADTDSYVKWAAALLGSRPDAVDGRLLVLDTPLVVSEAQQRSALAGSGLTDVWRVSFDDLPARLAERDPDVVLLAARGPLVRVLARVVRTCVPSSVIATGLPGISVPATRKALVYRASCDVFVLHSHREVREFTALASLSPACPSRGQPSRERRRRAGRTSSSRRRRSCPASGMRVAASPLC